MDWLRELSVPIHVIFGFGGLVAFWVPVVAPKGKRVHVLAGRVFETCAYVVAGTAMVSATVIFIADFGRPSLAASRALAIFLFYLALVTLASVRHAVTAVRRKEPARVDDLSHRVLAYTLMGSSVGVIAFALLAWTEASPVLLALSPVGILIGRSMRRFARGAEKSPRAWWYEHMEAMLGAGIAFHTAFAVFGASRLLDYSLEGPLAVLPWILPAAIGVPATALWTRHYRRRFGEL